MTGTEMVLETSVYSPFNHQTWLVAREYFIEFSCCECFKFYISNLQLERTKRICNIRVCISVPAYKDTYHISSKVSSGLMLFKDTVIF
jgi:hypothetical protein